MIGEFVSRKSNRIYKYIRSFTKQSTLPSSVHFNTKTESSNLGIASLFNEVVELLDSEADIGNEIEEADEFQPRDL